MLEIINQRYMEFLLEIDKKPKNISNLAKAGNLTLSVASTLISRWAMEGVVFKEKFEGGKEIIITPTEYGKTQINLLKQIRDNHQENKRRMKGGKK